MNGATAICFRTSRARARSATWTASAPRVGDDKLTYVGFSYGTYLGTLYAQLFPERVRALVLDGAVDPTLDKVQVNLQQAVGFESSLDAFFAWCADDGDCGFGDGEPGTAYDRLVRRHRRPPAARRRPPPRSRRARPRGVLLPLRRRALVFEPRRRARSRC